MDIMEKELITVPMATLDFYKYEEDGLTFYEFNATECQPPEPMVNTMHGLRMIESENDRLVGIFFHEPTPLFAKTASHFAHESIELESGDFRITFKKI